MYQSLDNILDLGNKSNQVKSRVFSHEQEYDLYFELYQLLKRLLCWDGSKRPSAEECLASTFFKVGNFAPCSEKHPGILLQKPSHPPEQADRSCESLSSCFQTDNVPAKPTSHPASDVLLQSPLLSQELMGAKSDVPQRKGHRKNFSMDDRMLNRHAPESCSVTTRRHKHKRVDTEQVSFMDRAVLSPPLADASLVGVTSTPVMVKEEMVSRQQLPCTPLMLTHHRPFESITGPAPKVLADSDFRTPPPSLLHHVIMAQSPQMPAFVSSDGTSPNTPKPSYSIIHPPSFDDVTSVQLEVTREVASPQQIPLSLHSLFPNPDHDADVTALHEEPKRQVSFESLKPGPFEVVSPRSCWCLFNKQLHKVLLEN